MLTSKLNSKRILFMPNTSTISQTQSGPSILMVHSTTSDVSMSQNSEILDSVYFSIHTTTPLQDIPARQRDSTKSECTLSGLPVYVKEYCKSCTICSHAKPMFQKPCRLLKQLLIPKK